MPVSWNQLTIPFAPNHYSHRPPSHHRPAINGIKESLGKPKRGPNGYSLFYQEKYEEMRSQCKRESSFSFWCGNANLMVLT